MSSPGLTGNASDLPVVIGKEGLQPTPPADLRQELVDLATEMDPGLTANLPGSLIEDIASTDTGALVVVDQAKVDLVNSLTPYAANDYLLTQLGNIYGILQGKGFNASVLVVFSSPNIGFAIPVGFTVADASGRQYVVQDGGLIADDGTSGQLFAFCTTPGIFAIPANSVTTLITSVPEGITLSATNPEAGTPASGAQTAADYRAQVLQAGLAASMGMSRYLKTLLGNVVGVQPRLVSARMANGGWEIIAGGGDPYQVAYAIFQSVFDLPSLTGSILNITEITNGNPGVVTTGLNHGLVTGQNNVRIAGVEGMTEANGGPYTVTVIDEKRFSFGVNTTLFGTYTGGGVVTPNARNVVVSVQDYPDTYSIPYVNPPQQSVTIALTWNTTAVNFVSDAAVAQLGAQGISDYVISIPVGAPINLFQLEQAFLNAIADILPSYLVSRMVFSVSINGIGVSPDAGTGLFEGDPESYFFMQASDAVITRG